MNTQVILETTINDKEFIISSAVRPCGKIGFYAHYLGELTQFSKVMGGEERKAHRVNPLMIVKGRRRIMRPFKSIAHALVMIDIYSNLDIRYF